MTKKSYGVFSWNVAKLGEAVSKLEAEGHFVRGYEIPKFSGYTYFEHEVLVFLEHAPDVLQGWKAKAAEVGMKVTAEVDMPKAPRSYGEPMKDAPEVPLPPAAKSDEKVKGESEPEKTKAAPAKSTKKTG